MERKKEESLAFEFPKTMEDAHIRVSAHRVRYPLGRDVTLYAFRGPKLIRHFVDRMLKEFPKIEEWYKNEIYGTTWETALVDIFPKPDKTYFAAEAYLLEGSFVMFEYFGNPSDISNEFRCSANLMRKSENINMANVFVAPPNPKIEGKIEEILLEKGKIKKSSIELQPSTGRVDCCGHEH